MSEPHQVSEGWQSPALLAACPICKRPRGAICCDPRGNGRWGKPHRSRLKAALALPPGEGPRRNDKGNPLQVYRARQAAGWRTDANGWVAPDGTGEDDWAASGRSFPEESWPFRTPPPSPMTFPLRIRTIKQTIAANIELLPEADLWRPIVEQSDNGGYLPREEAEAVLARLGYTPENFFDWCRQRQFITLWSRDICDVAELHEFWQQQQP